MSEFFEASSIVTFGYKDLDGKVLKICVVEGDGAVVVNGIDTETGHVYVLFSKSS